MLSCLKCLTFVAVDNSWDVTNGKGALSSPAFPTYTLDRQAQMYLPPSANLFFTKENSNFLPVLPHLPSLPCSGWVAVTSVKLLWGFPQSRDGTSVPWQLVSSVAHLDFRKTLSAPVLSSTAIRGCGLAKMGGWGTRLNYCIQCHLFGFFFF